MMNSKLTIIAIIAAVGLVGATFVFLRPNPETTGLASPIEGPEIELPPVEEPIPDLAPADPIPEPGDVEPQESIVIRVFNFEFTPAEIEVKRGTTITWLMREFDWPQGDAGFHNVAADGGEFASNNLRRVDETWSHTFEEVGEFSYFCEPHPWMIGKIIVVE